MDISLRDLEVSVIGPVPSLPVDNIIADFTVSMIIPLPSAPPTITGQELQGSVIFTADPAFFRDPIIPQRVLGGFII